MADIIDRLRMDEKLKNLAMTPEDWSILDKSVPKDEYRQIVNEYQLREEARLPFCKAIFGACIYFTKKRRCNSHDFCKWQRHKGDIQG